MLQEAIFFADFADKSQIGVLGLEFRFTDFLPVVDVFFGSVTML